MRDLEDVKQKSHQEKMDMLTLSTHLKNKIESMHIRNDDNMLEAAYAAKEKEYIEEIKLHRKRADEQS